MKAIESVPNLIPISGRRRIVARMGNRSGGAKQAYWRSFPSPPGIPDIYDKTISIFAAIALLLPICPGGRIQSPRARFEPEPERVRGGISARFHRGGPAADSRRRSGTCRHRRHCHRFRRLSVQELHADLYTNPFQPDADERLLLAAHPDGHHGVASAGLELRGDDRRSIHRLALSGVFV